MGKNEKIPNLILEDIDKNGTIKFSKKKIDFYKEMITRSAITIQFHKNQDKTFCFSPSCKYSPLKICTECQITKQNA